MMKKEYRKPIAKVFCIEATSVLCTSNVSADFVPYEDANNTNVGANISGGIWGRTDNPD